MELKWSKILVLSAGVERTVSCSLLMLFHYESGFRKAVCPAEVTMNFNRANSDSPASAGCVHVRVWVCVGLSVLWTNPCIRHRATSFVCLHLVGCEKRQRLGESCRETLQGLERMLIKASYSTASSFLTVPAAGSTTLCFLTTSSPLSLSALLYFCLLLFLSPSFPRLCLTRFLSLGLPPAIWKLKQQMFWLWVDSDVTLAWTFTTLAN